MPPPTLLFQYVLRLSGEGKQRLINEMDGLVEEGILPSMAGDIWSENGISILGITTYFINKEWELVERLVDAIPFSSQAHTGVNIERASKVALAATHIGVFKEGEVPSGGNTLPPVLEDTTYTSVHTKVRRCSLGGPINRGVPHNLFYLFLWLLFVIFMSIQQPTCTTTSRLATRDPIW